MVGEFRNLNIAERMKKAYELLERDAWKDVLQTAMDSRIAGENSVKWIHFYSGISSDLQAKLNVFTMGKSQRGKSYVARTIGSTFFADRFIDISELSGKSIYYEVKEKNNPDLYKNKILFIDEFNDTSSDTKAFIKKVTSHKTGPLTLKTVSDNKKFMEATITGIPVVWTNSMEVIKDTGNQIMNRFFKCNVNESITQSKQVEEFQKERIRSGELLDDSDILMAQTIVHLIMEEDGFIILNPVIKFIKQTDYSIHNRLPMFEALVGAITHAHRFNRSRFEHNGRKYLLASVSDNLEALSIWHENERYQELNIPQRFIKLLTIFEDGKAYTDEDMSYAFERMYGETLSPGSCYQYAHEMADKDILVSRKQENGRKVEFYYPQATNSSISSKHQLDLEDLSQDALAIEVKAVFERNLISNTQVRGVLLDLDSTVQHLMNGELPNSETKPDETPPLTLNQAICTQEMGNEEVFYR